MSPRSKPLVSIIIVTRNGKAITSRCLKSLIDVQHKEVIVVDNNSQDGTLRMLRNWKHYDVRVIENSSNLGFAEANNQGIRLATAPYVLFLNNDAYLTEDSLPELIAYLRTHTAVGAVQPMILFPDGSIDSIGSYMTPTGFLYHRAHRMQPAPSFLKTEAVYSLKGACMLWKRSVLSKIGPFDESYFAYFEESELCHRAKNHGYSVVVYPKTSIVHLGGFTSNSMDQRIVQYHNIKNRMATYVRHFSLRQLATIFPLHLLLSQLLVGKSLLQNAPLAFALQKGICIGILRGLWYRVTSNEHRSPLDLKKPDFAYYKALFSSLQGYSKVY